MNHHYADIRDKLGTPTWWDENAVPRYCKFGPDETADIYASEAVLMHIDCQNCGAAFKVAMTSHYQINPWASKGDEIVAYPTLAESIGDLHYGDPPNTGCCPAGPTMNSIPRRVLEFWRRAEFGDWERVPELEKVLDPEWAS